MDLELLVWEGDRKDVEARLPFVNLHAQGLLGRFASPSFTVARFFLTCSDHLRKT
jgi:hypothetical protein